MHMKFDFFIAPWNRYFRTRREASYSGLFALRFYVLTAVIVELTVWDVTPYIYTKILRSHRGDCGAYSLGCDAVYLH